jgi:tetratricopeptide (TPR) repeat protein
MQYWLQRLYPDRDIRIYNFGWSALDTRFVLDQLTRRLADQPDLIIVITGGNEFLRQDPEGQIAHIQNALSMHVATFRLLEWGIRKVMKPRSPVVPCQLVPWDRESASFKSKVGAFEKSMNLIATRTRQRGIKLILGTLPSNMADWPPVYKRLGGRAQRYYETVSRIQELLRNQEYGGASDAVAAGFSVYGQDAMLYFLRGKIQFAMGAYADARESFVKARDLDPFPARAPSLINAVIRKVASGIPGVYLVDLEKAYEEHSKGGLIGFDLVADQVHGTPLGESTTAQAIIQTMIEIGTLPPSPNVQQECCPVGIFLAHVGYLEPKSPLHLRALLHGATEAMKIPFLHYEISRMYLLEAVDVDANSWEAWANLATLSYFAGDAAAGARELRRATELHHAPLDVDDRSATPYLKQALEYSAGRTNGCGGPP